MLFFVDANILIYTRDAREASKREVARHWLLELTRREAAIVNLQVLNEVTHVALRKLAHLPTPEVHGWIEELRALGETVIDADVVADAWPIRSRYRLSWFDCLHLSAAERLGCTHVLTENMGANRQVGSLQLVNPFATQLHDCLGAS